MIHFLPQFFAACNSTTYFGIPTWYKYLGETTSESDAGTLCVPQVTAISDVLLIGAAVLEMLVRVAAMIAIMMIIWGGIKYITSQGEPDKTEQARGTIINGIVGMVIAIAATATITFLAGAVN